MELKIYSPNEDGFIKSIDWNHEEIKEEVAEKVSYYKNLIYTDDQIKDAKADKAKLNKFVQALETKRKEVKKQCLAPYEDFEKKMKEIVAIVNEPIALIDSQVKNYEEQKKAEKLELIKEFWNQTAPADFPFKFENMMNPKWLNVTTSMKSIQEEIKGIFTKYESDIATLEKLPEFSFEAIDVYKSTFDLNKAIQEGQRLAELQKRKEEAERQRAEQARLKAEAEQQRKEAEEQQKAAASNQEEQLPGQIGFTDAKTFEECMNPPVEELPQAPAQAKEWISFKALMTYEDAQALNAFFKARNIEFQAI